MTISNPWQLPREGAERYEQILVPAILRPAAHALVEWANLRQGESVIDVGCGTGAATRLAAERLGPSGRVVGVDVTPGMLEVARSLPAIEGAAIEWREASAYALPLGDQAVDVVLSAQMLQFLDDRPLALREMHRVLRAGGRVALGMWCASGESPYFHALGEALAKHIGADAATLMNAAFALSEAEKIRTLLVEAGFDDVEVVVKQLDLDLPRPRHFVPRHLSASRMAPAFDAAPREAQKAVIEEVSEQMRGYAMNGGIRVPFRLHTARAKRATAL